MEESLEELNKMMKQIEEEKESLEELNKMIKQLEEEKKRLELEGQAIKLKQEVDDEKDKLHPSVVKKLFKKVFS